MRPHKAVVRAGSGVLQAGSQLSSAVTVLGLLPVKWGRERRLPLEVGGGEGLLEHPHSAFSAPRSCQWRLLRVAGPAEGLRRACLACPLGCWSRCWDQEGRGLASRPGVGKQVFSFQADCVAVDKLLSPSEPQLSHHQRGDVSVGLPVWL